MGSFVPFLILLFVIALVLRIDLYFTVVWFLLGLYGLSRLWTQRAVRHLQAERQFVDHAFTGDEVRVGLTLRNTGRLPIPWIEVSESVPVDLRGTASPSQVLGLRGREKRRFQYTLNCRRRGFYALGPLRLETGDVLGVEERVLALPEPRRVTVYPRVVPLERLGLPTRSALVSLPARPPLFEDTSRVMGIRDYRPGDSPRRIHWTATARTGRLVVKQYQPAIARETLICLDLDLKDYEVRRYEATEEAIVVAASLAHHMVVREGLPVGLATEGRDASDDRRPLNEGLHRITLPPRTGRGHLMGVLEVLARIQVGSSGRFVDLLREESLNLTWGSTIVVITGRLSRDLAEMLLYLKRNGHAMALILVQPDYLRRAEDQQDGVAGIPTHRVWTDRDLAVWQ